MKKIFSKLSAAALLLTLASCELDYAPENQLVDEKVYKNERTAQAALMGCYVRLNVFLSGAPQDQNNYANNGYSLIYADMGTENLDPRANVNDYIAMNSSEYTSAEHDGMLLNLWHWGYNAIDFTNNVITGINKYGEYDSKMQLQHIAEAKFIRAYTYFQLLCLFGDKALMGNDSGMGVVIRLDPYSGYNPEDIQGRDTNANCWALIIKDLTEALPDLPDEVPAVTGRIRANKAVTKALLSRVYLYKGTYTDNKEELGKARDLAAEVLATAGYTFSPSATELTDALFPSNEYSQGDDYPNPTTRSNELIFFEPSRISTDQYPNGIYYYRKTTYYVPATMTAKYDADDIRATKLLWQGSTTDNPSDITTMKYSANSYCDVIYMRLAEVKLTFAEATARTTGVSDQAVNHLNDVYRRAFPAGQQPAYYTYADFSSPADFIKRVLVERNRELAYEGHYRWDIIRTNNTVGDTKMAAVDPARWNMPVPEYEIRISYGAITQNSGYAE